jgi:acylphosphatase
MNDSQTQRLHAKISGRVQGVGFRFFTYQVAQEHNLTGWVRNLHDGRVEVLAEGPHQGLNTLLRTLRKGPMSAEVADIDYDFSEAQGKHNKFNILGTV